VVHTNKFFKDIFPDLAMLLLLWGALLTVLTSTVAPLVAYLVNLTCGISDYEIQLRKEILSLKKVRVCRRYNAAYHYSL
jgi:hypothetical protein